MHFLITLLLSESKENPTEIFSQLLAQVRKTEVLDTLVSLLQHLMLVRKDGRLG